MDKRIIAPVLILLAAAGGGWWYWQHSRAKQTSANRLLLYGNIDTRVVNLAFDAEGRIAEMPASEGWQVRKGEILARLDTRRLDLVRNEAQANVATQRERVKELEAGTRPEEIRKLEAELEAAHSRATNAERNYRRIRDVETKHLASPQQLDDARTSAEAADAETRAVSAALALARAGPRQEDIAAAKAVLVAMEAKLALAERNLEEASLQAPSDGIIQSRILEPGDMASPQRPVYTLALTDPLWARMMSQNPRSARCAPACPPRSQATVSQARITLAGWATSRRVRSLPPSRFRPRRPGWIWSIRHGCSCAIPRGSCAWGCRSPCASIWTPSRSHSLPATKGRGRERRRRAGARGARPEQDVPPWRA